MLDEQRVAREGRAVAGALAALGCRGDGDAPGPRVALLCGNSAEFVIVRDAVTRVGAALVPINPRLAPPEIAFIARDCGARVVLAEPALIEAAVRARAALHDDPKAPQSWFAIGAAGDRAGESSSAGADHLPAITTVAAAPLVAGAADREPPHRIGTTLLYTSGTTGRPKGCVRTETQETARADELIASYGLRASDVHIVACPLAHSAPGIFLRACRKVGAATVILPRFTAEGMLAAIARHRGSVFFMVPTMYERIVALPAEVRARYDVSSVRVAVVAGAPMSPAAKRRVIDWLGPDRLWEFYGSSETGTISVLPPADQLSRPGSVGIPAPGVDLEVREPDGAIAAADDVGEIWVRSPTVMRGYLDPETGRAVSAGDERGFVSVGDLGRVDPDGYLYLVDRKHDTIISGGANVYPAEVERALCELPEVAGAVSFGVADPSWGQIVAAVVALRPDASVEPGGLRAALRGRIAAYKIPKALALVSIDELPVGASGKPNRRAAAARFADSPHLVRHDV